jgi:preprotein translocase subunit SecE
METYKKDQGKITRRVAFAAAAIFVIWGGNSLYGFLVNVWDGFRTAFAGGVDGYVVPILGQRTNYAFLVSLAVTLGGLFLLWRFLNAPRRADFLIETDEEMRKVTWPNWKEAWSSSVIVLVFVALLTVFLWVSDQAISSLMALLLA